MLFHSYEYLFFFLPVTLAGYFILQHFQARILARCFLLAASFFFYAWWNLPFLGLLIGSILLNYIVSRIIWRQKKQTIAKGWLIFGLISNLGVLGFFKYTDFCLHSLNTLLGTDWPLLHVALPLAISFYTFQQIGFLVDVYRGQVKKYSLLDYALFTSFFPQLISGPIVRHDETMDQLRAQNYKFSSHDCAAGIYQFVIGLGKKVLIADTLAQWVSLGFDSSTPLLMTEAWITSLAYTLQIYYDFSGYTDMAIGTARMFRIKLPINFDSPYRAVNIQDFWRRWHMTLSRLLRDTIYIPLGGNRKGAVRTAINTCITFLLCGLWHGAGWTFVIWGGLHGLALVVWRIFKAWGGKLPKWLGWMLTMLFVNAAWVFFRAPDLSAAWRVLKAMVDIKTLVIPMEWLDLPAIYSTDIAFGVLAMVLILLGGLMTLVFPNSNQMAQEFVPRPESVAFIAAIAAGSIVLLYGVNEFIYFNF